MGTSSMSNWTFVFNWSLLSNLLLRAPVIREVLILAGAAVVVHAVIAAGPAVGNRGVTWHCAAVHTPAVKCVVVQCSAVQRRA